MATDLERLAVYEQILHDINMFAAITHDRQRLNNLIELVCNWSYAHRVGNGVPTDEEQRALVEKAFKCLQRRDYAQVSKDCVYGDKP